MVAVRPAVAQESSFLKPQPSFLLAKALSARREVMPGMDIMVKMEGKELFQQLPLIIRNIMSTAPTLSIAPALQGKVELEEREALVAEVPARGLEAQGALAAMVVRPQRL